MIINGTVLKVSEEAGGEGLAIHEVCEVIGETNADLGTVCTSPNVNKWSFRKPIRHSSKTTVTDADIQNIYCGLNMIPVTKILAQSLSREGGITTYTKEECIAEISEWTYNQPRGKATYNEWYRLLDFNKYNHAAVAPDALWSNKAYSAEDINNIKAGRIEITNTGDYAGSYFKITAKKNTTTGTIPTLDKYSSFAMRFGLADSTKLGDCTNMDIPIDYITGSITKSEAWRVCIAVWIPSAGMWALFASTMTLAQALSTSSPAITECMPSMDSNPYGALRISLDANGQYKEYTAVPLLVKNLGMKYETYNDKQYYSLYATANAVAVCMPSGNTGFSFLVGDAPAPVYFTVSDTVASNMRTFIITNTDTVNSHICTYKRVVVQSGNTTTYTQDVTIAANSSVTVTGPVNQNVSTYFEVTAQDGVPISI